MRRIRVLVVDDSVVARRLVTESLAGVADIEVVGTAPDGRLGLTLIRDLRPDLVTLDVEMPEMDGIAAMSAIHAAHPKLPVVMLSSYTERGAVVTIEALARGAADYVTKPPSSANYHAAVRQVREQLVPKITSLCAAVLLPPPPSTAPARPAIPSAKPRPKPAGRVEVVAIAASTGGPNAIEQLLIALPPDFPAPIVVVQHMPARFTHFLAERLDSRSSFKVHEVAGGETVTPGTVWIAPGDFHMELERVKSSVRTRLHQGEPVNSCRPSADVLFRSVAELHGPRALAVVLTGMGRDALDGCKMIRDAGGQVLVQDEESSVVWGMPRIVAEAGLADQVLPLDEIAREMCRRVRGGCGDPALRQSASSPNESTASPST